ncbi:MAG: MFS transporter [Ruminococcaceae bacterium]|nr:MFS transporter [Oscillospiraceae bacterium]
MLHLHNIIFLSELQYHHTIFVSKISYSFIISIYIGFAFCYNIRKKEGTKMEEQNAKRIKFSYTWVIVGLSFLIIATSLGLCSSGRNLYLTAITDALHIPRGAFSLTNTIRFFTTTVVNLFFGKLVSQFGTKKLICAGFVSLICFALINSFAEHLFVFYIGSIFLGVGISWTGTTMVSAIVNRWCKSNKGTVTGAILAANGIGGAIAVQIISPIIFEEGKPFGYRTSYRMVAVVLAVVLLLVILLFRDRPKGDTSEVTVTKKKRKARGTGWVGMDYSAAVRKPYFYIAILCMFFTGMALQGLGGISFPHMYDIGIDVAFVANISSISSILLTVSKFSTGFMYDKLGMRLSMNICFFCAFISITGLILITDTPAGHVIAFVRGIFSSFALPLETVMLPLFAMELFGNKEYEKFVGVFASASTAGFAIGSPFGNVCHDIFGSYNLAFVIFGAMLIFVTVAMQYVLSAARRDRMIIETSSIDRE